MFTGLVESTGQIAGLERLPSGKGLRVRLTSPLLVEAQPLGASLAVDGVCLTVVAWQSGEIAAIIGPETLERSTLGQLRIGQTVNLERPLRLGDRLGGHLVAGHVDGIGQISRRVARAESVDVTVQAAPALLRYIVEKGSITIDGISLTVNHVDAESFSVSLVPHTQTMTTLSQKSVGSPLNLEVDLIGKYVEKLVSPLAPSPKLTLETLKENGFADK